MKKGVNKNSQDVSKLLEAIKTDEDKSRSAKLRDLYKLQVKLEASLLPRQAIFIREYFKDFNGAQAYVRAGYESKQPGNNAGNLLANPIIKDYITVAKAINSLDINITADFVLHEFYKLAKVTARDLYKENGELIPPHELPVHIAAAISEIKQEEVAMAGGATKTKFSYKLHSKVAALDALGKHVGIYEKDNKQKQLAQVVAYLPENGREVSDKK